MDLKKYLIENLNRKKIDINFCKNRYPILCVSSKEKNKITFISKILSFFAGIINGLFGGGAGMLIVPILEKINKIDTKKAHATTVFIVLPLCVFSIISYLFIDKFDFNDGLWVCTGVILGGVLGALLLKIINAKYIRFGFAFLVFATGVKLLIDSIIKII